jgi:hypothetical protein
MHGFPGLANGPKGQLPMDGSGASADIHSRIETPRTADLLRRLRPGDGEAVLVDGYWEPEES